MKNKEQLTFKNGDRVYYHDKLYKIDSIYTNGTNWLATIHSIRSKINEIIYNVNLKDLTRFENEDKLNEIFNTRRT